jgi:hypothetical protein
VPLGEQVRLAQEPQVVARAALREPERARELADRELLALEQREDAQARRIGEQAQEAGEVGQGGAGIGGQKHTIMNS